MSEGIHVTNLPASATEKQLKVYFSNPRNGGGHVKQVLHPLPRDSAVVLFENPRLSREIVQREHVLRGQRLSVRQLPKQIYGKVTVELEKAVSAHLERSPSTVDELQYLGDLAVQFSYDTERYILKGTWYQLEWALYYLNGLLGDDDIARVEGQRQHKGKPSRDEYEELGENVDEEPPPPIKHEIKKPNIPMVKQGKNKNDKGDNPTGYDVRKTKERETARNIHKNTFNDSGSDEDNEGAYYTREGYDKARRYVSFTEDTDFTEDKQRPARRHGRRPMGIDIAQTDLGAAFGESPLTYESVLPNGLKVQVAMDDITKQSADVIVNPTTGDLSVVSGVSRAIVVAGGHGLQKEMVTYLNQNGPLDLAQVMHTSAGGSLHRNVMSVMHTVGPAWNEDDSERATHYLVCTYINCFMYADSKLWLESMATPVISAGAFGFPLDVCIQAFYDALLLFSTHGQQTNNHLKEIRLICFDQETSMAAIAILQSLFDCDTAQAVNAAKDRYNSRIASSKFTVENFTTEAVDEKRQAEKPKKVNKNKNAEVRKRPKSTEDMHKAKDNDNNRAEAFAARLRDNGDIKAKESEENDKTTKTATKMFEDQRVDDTGDRDGRYPVLTDRTIDPKKSLMDIDRPKFKPDPDAEENAPNDDGDFAVGMIGADDYVKKFEDLLASDNKADDVEYQNEEESSAEKEDVVNEKCDNDVDLETVESLEASGRDSDINSDDQNQERKVEENAKSVTKYDDEALDGVEGTNEREECIPKRDQTNIEKDSIQLEESKYEFVDLDKEDAEITEALQRELGIGSIVAIKGMEHESSDSRGRVDGESDDSDGEDEPYTGPKVLKD